MNAIRLHEPGGPDKLRYETVPAPRPGPAEVLVQLKAAALNHRDIWIRRGMQLSDRLPLILGSDGAGLVAEVGAEVTHLAVGWTSGPCSGTSSASWAPPWEVPGISPPCSARMRRAA